jgi:hypothetical protein
MSLQQDLAHPALVLRMAVGMQQADANRPDAKLPELVGQPVVRDWTAGLEQEQREQRTLFPASQRECAAAGPDLEAADRLVVATVDRLSPGRTGGGSYYGFPGVSVGLGLGLGSFGRHVGTGIFTGIHL